MSPGRALVPYGCAGTPAVDNACATARTVTTWPASVCGISAANAVEDDEKSREKKRSHWLAPPIAPRVPNSRHYAEVPPSKEDSQFWPPSTIYGPWLHEIRHDGFRLRMQREGKRAATIHTLRSYPYGRRKLQMGQCSRRKVLNPSDQACTASKRRVAHSVL